MKELKDYTLVGDDLKDELRHLGEVLHLRGVLQWETMLQTEKVKLKVNLPERFTGSSKENYEEFEKKLRTYLCLTDSGYAIALRWAITQTMPITTASINTNWQEPAKREHIHTKLQSFLYYTLLSLIEGSAQTIVEQVEEENGLEAYRKLHQRFAKTKMQNAIMRMAAIVNMKFNDNANFETTFSDWEYEIHRFNESVETKLQDEVKVGILIAGTTEKAP